MLVGVTFLVNITAKVCTFLMSCKIKSCFYHHWLQLLIGNLFRLCHNFSVLTRTILSSDKYDLSAIFAQMTIWRWPEWKFWTLTHNLQDKWLFHTSACLQSWATLLLLSHQFALFMRACYFFSLAFLVFYF